MQNDNEKYTDIELINAVKQANSEAEFAIYNAEIAIGKRDCLREMLKHRLLVKNRKLNPAKVGKVRGFLNRIANLF